jgi:twinkle protein
MLYNEESKFLYHAPCPDCGSKDNLAVYTDNHTYCFGCKATKYSNTQEQIQQEAIQEKATDMIDGTIQALPKRKINQEMSSFAQNILARSHNNKSNIVNNR